MRKSLEVENRNAISKGVALKFVILLGVVSLFADMTYEGARSITGQVENGESASIAKDLDIEPMTLAVHTASDIPLTATGPGAMQFVGVQDNTSVFFKMMRAFGGSFPRVYYDGTRVSRSRRALH